MCGAAITVPLQCREKKPQDARVEPGDGRLHFGSGIEDHVKGVLREKVGDLRYGGAEFGDGGGVIDHSLRMVIRQDRTGAGAGGTLLVVVPWDG